MAEPVFPDFELVPDEALNLTPSEESDLIDALDAVVPGDDASDTIPFGRSVLIDWDEGVAHDSIWVSGVDAVVQVLQAALNTVRGTSPIMPDWFGLNSMSPLLGRPDDTELRAVHAADVRDTLLSAHERVTSVLDVRWIPGADGRSLDFEADVDIDGEVKTLVGGTTLV